jgi:FAD/FMN-containing dehydrogenase
MQIKKEIEKIFNGEVFDDEKTRHAYENDASLFEVMPELVVYPKDVGDIKSLVSLVSEHKKDNPKLSITARAAGTGMSGGSLNESIILDVTKHINHIGDVKNDSVTVEPGTFYRDMEKETLKSNLLMPSYPASKDLCAVGGIVSNNSSGEKTLNYGCTRDYVQKLKAILSDGNEYEFGPLTKDELDSKMAQQDFEGQIYRDVFNLVTSNESLIKNAKPNVSKNSTGYAIWEVWDGKMFNLSKLIVGSQGTLGIVTEATFKLIQPKTHSTLLVMFLKNFDNLSEIVNKTLEHKPESFESYDDHTFSLAVKFFPDMVRSLKTGIISLGFRLIPEFFMILTGGLPKLVLLAEFTGDTKEEVKEKAQKAQKDLKKFNIKSRITNSEKDSGKYWTIRRESFNLLRHHVKKGRTAPFIDDTVIRPESLPEFLPRLNEIMDNYDITYTIAGHIGNGNFHIIPIMDFTQPESKKIFEELSEKVFDLVFEFGGSMSGEHNDGIVRTPYLKKMYGEEVYSIFVKIKNIFDPQNIFNPGKKIGGTWDYTMKHLDTD